MATAKIVKRSFAFTLTGGVNNAANNIFTFTVPTTLQSVSLYGAIQAYATDGVDAQSRSAVFAIDVVNKAGTLTATGTCTASANIAASAGTLTITCTPSVSATTVTVQVTPVSSLATTSVVIRIYGVWLALPTAGPTLI